LESLGRNPFRHDNLRTGLIKNTVDQLQAKRQIYLTAFTLFGLSLTYGLSPEHTSRKQKV